MKQIVALIILVTLTLFKPVKVVASPETFLNLEEVNELSKSIVKIDYDMMDQSNGNLIQFRNELDENIMADRRGRHDPFYPIAAKADSRSAIKSILSSKPTDSLICDGVIFRLALSASLRLTCVVVKG